MFRIFSSFSKSIQSSKQLINFKNTQYSMPYYAVAAGWEVGIFDTWAICEKKVKGFSKPKFKKFKTREEAQEFLKANGVNTETPEIETTSYNPRQDAVPLARTPKKEREAKLRQLVEQKLAKSKDTTVVKKRLRISSSEESDSDVELTPSPTEIEDFWPDDVEWDENDEDILLAAAAEVEGIPEVPLKRLFPFEDESGASSSKILKKYSHESKIWIPMGLKKIGNFEFPIDSEGYVIVYTDGSCLNNGHKNSVGGFGVYFSDDHPLNAAKPVVGRVTNNSGEIQASIHAIRLAKDLGIKKLCLSTDSQFLINSATSWIKNWKRKGWKLKSGDPVKNQEDFAILDQLLDGSVDIKWNYVKGHKGIVGNEKADRLAREGAALYKSMNGK